jgi:hypothetical protein
MTASTQLGEDAWRRSLLLRSVRRWRFFAVHRGSRLLSASDDTDKEVPLTPTGHATWRCSEPYRTPAQLASVPRWQTAVHRASMALSTGKAGCVPAEVEAEIAAAGRAQRLGRRQLLRRALTAWSAMRDAAAADRVQMQRAVRRWRRLLLTRALRSWRAAAALDASDDQPEAAPAPLAPHASGPVAPSGSAASAGAAVDVQAVPALALPLFPTGPSKSALTLIAAHNQTHAQSTAPALQGGAPPPAADPCVGPEAAAAAGEAATPLEGARSVPRAVHARVVKALVEVQLPRLEARRIQRQAFCTWCVWAVWWGPGLSSPVAFLQCMQFSPNVCPSTLFLVSDSSLSRSPQALPRSQGRAGMAPR